MDIKPTGAWDMTFLPVGPDTLNCRFENAGWLLWRTLDVNGDATGGGALPTDKVVNLMVGA